MGVRHLILTMNPSQTMFDADTFIEEAQRRWPRCQAYKKTEYFTSDAGANISPPQMHHHS